MIICIYAHAADDVSRISRKSSPRVPRWQIIQSPKDSGDSPYNSPRNLPLLATEQDKTVQEYLYEMPSWKKVHRVIDVKNKTTLLMRAAQEGEHKAVGTILSYDVSGLDYQDVQKKTALMHAVGNGHQQVVAELLKYSPNLWLQDENHYSVFTLIEIYKMKVEYAVDKREQADNIFDMIREYAQ